MRGRRATQKEIERAREQRAHATAAERTAWALLRNRRVLGLKFRRQHVIDGFTVDYYRAELNLVLEIDGAIHSRPEQMA